MLVIAGGIILAVIALFVGLLVVAGICEAARGTSGTSGGGGGFWLVAIVAVLVYLFTNGHL